MKHSLRSLVLRLVTMSMLVCAPLAPAHAVIVDTEQAILMSDRAHLLDRVNTALQRSEVREQLVSLGVDPAQASARINGLSASELAAIDHRLATLPAGGSVLGVLGIVLIVLIILDMVGVTNVFSKI